MTQPTPEIGDQSGDESLPKVLDQLQAGSLGPARAAELLAPLSGDRKMFAGRLLIEDAYQSPDRGSVAARLLQARELFEASIDPDTPGQKISPAMRAYTQCHLAYMPALGPLLVGRRLPSPDLAQGIYGQTIGAMRDLAQYISYAENNAQRHRPAKPFKALGLLVLTQRFALQEIGPETWFPFWAHVTEGGNDGVVGGRPGRQVTVWTNEGTLRPAYGVHVRNARPENVCHASLPAGVSVIEVGRDMRLAGEELSPVQILQRIADESWTELHQGDAEAAGRLDVRMSQVVDRLDDVE